MATKKTKVVVNSNGRNIDHTVEAAANGKAPVRIKVQKGVKYLLKGDDGFAPENVTLTRVGNDLQITLEGETSPGVVLEGYYAQSEPVGLYGVAEDGQLYAYARTDGAGDIYALAEGQSAPVALGGDSYGSGAPYLAGTEAGGNDLFGGMLPLLMTGGLAALGLGAIAAASGSDGDTAPSLPPVMPPPDVRPPGKPGFDGIGGAYDDVGPIKGQIQPGGQTDDTRPDFFGTGTPGNTITMYDNGKEIGKTLVDGNGAWHFTPPKDLSEGNHSITITESDPAGREGEPSDPFEFGVDTTPPPKPEWNGGSSEGPGAVIDDVGPIKGRVPPGGATDDQRPDFDGQGTPGDTIIVLDHGKEIGRVEVNGDGVWTFTPPTDLSEGEHSITIVERDPAGNESEPSDPFDFVVDITPPEQPQVGGANDNMGEYQGPITPGGVTDDRQPEFHGEGTPGDTIVIKDGDTVIGTTEVDENGAWTFTPSTDLKEGDHSITVIARDPAGNESKPSDPFDFEIDVTPPDASKLAITGVADDVGEVTGNVASGGKTDDSRPLLSGTGTAGDTIIVTVKDSTGSRELGRAIVEADGKWTLQVSTPLLQGKNEFTAIEMDPTGNHTAPTAPYTVILDSVPPSVPAIQNVQDDVGPQTGMLQKGQVTDDARPTIIGTAQAGNTVKIYDNGTKIGEVVADANGKWSYTPEANLADGTHNITATATNPVGQTSDATGIWNFVVDATPPGQVSDLVVTDDVGGKQGALKDGETTDDDRPTFGGKAEPGATVNVYDNGIKIGEAPVDENGDWSFTPTTPLTSGEHAFTTEVVDPAGNSSGQGDALNVVVDAIPATVLITALVDDQGTVTGTISANGMTDDTKPEIQGTGKAGSTIKVYDGSTLLGETTVKANGTWSVTPTADLGEGAHAITATATDKAGNTSAPTQAFNFTVDTVAPTAPTIESVLDDVGAKQEPLVSGGVTDDPSPTLSGKAEAGSTVIIKDGTVELGKVVADAEGKWSYTPTSPLAEGEHKFTVTATDKAGNTSTPSAEFVVNTDYTPPDASKLAITGVADDVGEVTGNVTSGSKTDDSRPVISGTGTAGDTIIVMVKDSTGTHKLGEAIVDANGKWALPVTTPLAAGINEFTAIEQDPAGNQTAPSASYSIDVETGRPEVPVIQNVQDDVGVVHMLQKGEVTDDARPTIIGTAQAGTTVKVYDNGTKIGEVVADANGKWSVTPTADLADGTHNITATATNPVGQTSDATGIWNFVVDTAPPGPVTGLEVLDDVGAKTGTLENGDTTDDSKPEFKGKAEPGATVNLYDGDTKIGTAVADPDGNWSITPTTPLGDGAHSLTTEVVDPAGNSSGKGPALDITVDTSKVEVSISKLVDDQGTVKGPIDANGTTDDKRPEIQGTGKAGSTIKVYDGSTLLGETVVKADGTWSVTPTADLGEGAHAITATATDKAGNTSAPTQAFNFTVDTVAPTAPTIESVLDDVGAKQEPLVSGGVTDDPSPTLSGKAEAGSTVIIKDGTVELGKVVADAEGKWSYTPTSPLAEGEHKFTVTATDKAGNTSAPSAEFVVNTDYTPPDPSKLAITGVEDDVGGITGNVASGATTDDSRPVISGTGTAGDTIIVMVKDSTGTHKLGEAIVDANGKWTLPVTTPLLEGSNEFTAIEVDPAGNATAPSAPYTVILDSVPPSVPVIQNVQDDVGVVHMLQKGEVTDDAMPTIIGTAQPGNTVKIYDNGTKIGEVVADASGKWSYTPEANLADGAHNITATATNSVGQTSDATGIWNFVVDTAPPGPVTGLEVLDDVGAKTGTLENGDTTDDNKPTFNGKAEPGATVKVYDNGTLLGSAPVDGNGDWTFTPTTPLANGPHALTTEVVDPAGNSSGQSDPLNLIVDNIPGTLEIVALVDDQGDKKGPIDANGVTDDTKPEIQGTGKAGSTIKVYDGATLLGETVVKADGTWSVTPTADLGEGPHAITATAIDKAGNPSEPTKPFNFTVDTAPPATPSIDAAADDVGAKQEPLVSGGVTDDPSPTLSGKAEAGSTVTINDNGAKLGTVVADANGNWVYTPTTPLAEGEHRFTVTATDKAGNTSTPSPEFVLTTDYTPPPASAATLSDDAGEIKGPITSGTVTDDDTPTYAGKTEPNATVVIYDDGKEIGRVQANATGDWSFTPETPLAPGAHSFSNAVTDVAGNVGQPGAAIDFTVDVQPATVSITGATDNTGDILGEIAQGGVTDDATPTLHGKATPGGTVKVYDGTTVLGSVVADANGDWRFTPSTALGEGQYELSATVTTAAHGESAKTAVFDFTVDLTAPGAPTIVAVLDDVGSLTINVVQGGVTDDTRPQFKGKAEPGSTVKVYDGSTLLGETTANAAGDWSVTPTTPLGNGAHNVTVTATDAAGNVSVPSAAFDFTVDATPPAKPTIVSVADDVGSIQGEVPLNGVTDDPRPVFTGKAEANSTVVVYDKGVELKRVPVDASGNWTWTPTAAMGNGVHTITVKAVDQAGNLSAPSDAFGFTVSTVPPPKPVIVSVYDDVGSVQGDLYSGDATDDTRPLVTGKAEANSTVIIFDNGVEVTRVQSDASGNWTYMPATALADGGHSISAIVINKAGVASVPSAAFGFTVDTTPPTQTATVSDIGKDSGFSGVDYLTNDGSAGRLMQGNLSGVLAKGEILEVSTDGGATWKEAFVSGSKWSVQDDHSHADSWTVQTRVVNAAGNAGAVKSQEITLDAVAPNAPTSVEVDARAANVTVKLADTGLKIGHVLDIVSNGKHLQYALTQADINAQSVKLSVPADMTGSVVVGVIDPAGNVSDYRTTAPLKSEVLTVNNGYMTLYPTSTGTYLGNSSVKVVSEHPINSHSYVSLLWVGAEEGVHFRTDFLLDDPASRIQFTYSAESSGHSVYVAFFDAAGNEIDRVQYPPIEGAVDFTAPAGKGVASFSYLTPGGDGGGTLINDMTITRPGGTSQLLAPAQVQDIQAGAQPYHGGDGDNVFGLSNAADLSAQGTSINGGGGVDTLKLTGADQTLDLTALAGKVSSVEIIDLTGSGNNTLKLSLADVMNNGAKDQFVADGRVQMMVKGNAGDAVTLSDVLPNGTDPGDWSKKTNVTVGGVVYEVYQHSGFGAELLVQQGVTVTLQNAGAATFHISAEPEAFVLDHATQAYTESDDMLIARLGYADRLEGGAGNDTFAKVGTGDTVHGGAGDDVIRVNSGDFAHIDGGLGIDTLVMDGKAMHIDLSALGLKVQGVEKFDLGAGGNTLALSTQDVLAGGARDMVVADGKVQMLVNGANGDVNLLGGDDSWAQGSNATVGGVTYSVYTNLAGTAELLVEDKVHVTIL